MADIYIDKTMNIDQTQSQQIPIQITRGCLVASLQGYLDNNVLKTFQSELLLEIKQHEVHGVIMDMSNVVLLDGISFKYLKVIANSISLLGAYTIFSGFRPTVASALVGLELDFLNIEATLQQEQAFKILESKANQLSKKSSHKNE